MTYFINNPRPFTFAAGICFLLLVISAPIGLLIVPEQIVVAGDATTTALNLKSNLGLFQIGMLSQVVIVLTEIVLTALLFMLLKPSSPTIALMLAFARLAMTVIIAINIIPHLMMAELASGASYLSTFTPEQIDTLILFFFETHMMGTVAWQFLFALHLLLVGYAVFRSTYLPRFIGIALMIGCIGYGFDSFGRIYGLMDNSAYAMTNNILLGVSGVGELGFGLWLLIKGVNQNRWREKTLAQ
ncbi:DUF4386 domain-containing protein [Maritalea sp.]|uniref:DUF4386 domain-containing protein n=1 Tax=Maritalea sp. TaxID=2003361 RepID=UPI003EF179B0